MVCKPKRKSRGQLGYYYPNRLPLPKKPKPVEVDLSGLIECFTQVTIDPCPKVRGCAETQVIHWNNTQKRIIPPDNGMAPSKTKGESIISLEQLWPLLEKHPRRKKAIKGIMTKFSLYN